MGRACPHVTAEVWTSAPICLLVSEYLQALGGDLGGGHVENQIRSTASSPNRWRSGCFSVCYRPVGRTMTSVLHRCPVRPITIRPSTPSQSRGAERVSGQLPIN